MSSSRNTAPSVGSDYNPCTPAHVGCTHVSVHLLRFADGAGTVEIGDLEAPPATSSWKAFVDIQLGEDIGAALVGKVWGVIGLHTSGASADATVLDASGWLPLSERAVESWHGALDVVRHRGEVNWLDPANPGAGALSKWSGSRWPSGGDDDGWIQP